MAEFLIRIRDKPKDPDPYVDIKRSKRGDVICACPDGWVWSQNELTNPDWRIIKVPGLADAVSQQLVTVEAGDERLNKMLRRRQYKLDVDYASLPQADKAYLRDDSRAQASITISKALAQSLVTLKPAVQDPAVIG